MRELSVYCRIIPSNNPSRKANKLKEMAKKSSSGAERDLRGKETQTNKFTLIE